MKLNLWVRSDGTEEIVEALYSIISRIRNNELDGDVVNDESDEGSGFYSGYFQIKNDNDEDL